jgi:hypothetical protein
MARIEKEDRQEEKHNSNSIVPNASDLPKKEDTIEIKNTADIKKHQTQTQIQTQTILIPKETIVIGEDKYARINFWVQSILAIIGICTLFAFILFGYLQHQDSINNLKMAQESANASAKDTRQSLALTERNIAIADSSLKLTRQSNERAERGLRLTEKNMFITTEISKTAIQPFICIDTMFKPSIEDIKVGKIPYVNYRISNTGATPAYRVVALNRFIPEFIYQPTNIDSIIKSADTVGYFLGSNKTLSFPAYFLNRRAWEKEDSIYYMSGMPLLFLSTIIYEDAFGQYHFTEEGFTQVVWKPVLVGLRKYNRTDHDEKKQTKNKTRN